MDKTICELVRDMETNYRTGTVKIGDYVDHSMHETVEQIIAYLNSKHINGLKDSLGREKPFPNISISTANVWEWATDIDRKNMRISHTKSGNLILAFVAQVLLNRWMIKSDFGTYLNQWGKTLARFGSAVTKVIKKDGELNVQVIPWNRIICDPVSFESMPVIEKIYYTPAQLLMKKEFDKEKVKELIEKTTSVRENISGEGIDNQDNFIEVYEIHGEMPLSYLTDDDKDKDTYREQMHVVSFVLGDDNEYSDFTLYKGKEEKSPYQLDHLREEEGRTLGVGAVELMFEVQWMMNHTAKEMKDYLDMASRMIFQTADSAYLGRNVMSVEVGNILIHSPNNPLTPINVSAVNISALQSFAAQFQTLGRELSGTPDAYRGNPQPSGTSGVLYAQQIQQAGSNFRLMTQNKGLALEKLLREHIIPFLKTQMDTSEEITAILDDQNITQLDSLVVPREAIKRYNSKVVNDVLNDRIPSPYVQGAMEAEVKKEFDLLGKQRFFKPDEIETTTWKEVLKDFEWEVSVDITDEMKNKQELGTILTSVFQTLASLGGQPMSPDMKLVFDKIMNNTGVISSLELSNKAISPVAPMMGGGNPQVGAGMEVNQTQ